ncbi:MAG: hypothetical protein ABJ263_03865, partial [Tateyamaria sp.]|uniref:hypothetical protein n=1 Tax=Tateyamaria sp. TaxID=1929288 RepID=UPI003281F67D
MNAIVQSIANKSDVGFVPHLSHWGVVQRRSACWYLMLWNLMGAEAVCLVSASEGPSPKDFRRFF